MRQVLRLGFGLAIAFAAPAGAGSVVEISAGGDFTAAPRLATGLNSPSLCFGPGGDVYATVPEGPDRFDASAP